MRLMFFFGLYIYVFHLITQEWVCICSKLYTLHKLHFNEKAKCTVQLELEEAHFRTHKLGDCPAWICKHVSSWNGSAPLIQALGGRGRPTSVSSWQLV